ncbi:MAG: hypothetical protein JNM09_19500 [Blastocatellia bacterium]|nr:hypothetical protein [Blastocatellia bacterium]
MKKLILTIIMLVGVATASYGRLSTGFELPLGTFQGSGKIAGGVHTIKIVSNLGTVIVYYGGATNCVAILSETNEAGLYEEIDQTLPSGKPSPSSCKEKGFVFLVNDGTGLIYHWGATKDDAKGKPLPVALKKTKK